MKHLIRTDTARCLKTAAGSLLLLLTALSANASTTWTGAESNDWNDENNWTNGVPGASNPFALGVVWLLWKENVRWERAFDWTFPALRKSS